MKQEIFTLKSEKALTADVRQMELAGDTSAITRPGQFVNILVDGCYLRRPISVCDRSEGSLTLVYKVVGKGTKILSGLQPGAKLDLLVGLGNGYTTEKAGNAPLLIGGGVGVPPLYGLARALRAEGKKVRVLLGFNTAREIFYREEFEALGAQVTVTTADGSFGTRGFVTDALPGDYSFFYTCGPEPMLKAVYAKTVTGGEFSFEERMGCGFGACMGCTCRTVAGPKRICRDGPVLEKEEILWQK